MQLSKRLQAVADMVTDGKKVADVGTDHAYIPIYLVENGKIPGAIALDVNKGPLNRAREHIAEYKLLNYIDIRLSDGLAAFHAGEANTLIIAGMGGGLVIKILSEGEQVLSSFDELILQPQSEIDSVRKYLFEKAYQILMEDMVLEDGKYYPMMKAVYKRKEANTASVNPLPDIDCLQLVYFKYGQMLLEQKNPVLKMFLEKEYQKYTKILKKLSSFSEEHVLKRRQELELEIKLIRSAMQFYENETTDEIFRKSGRP